MAEWPVSAENVVGYVAGWATAAPLIYGFLQKVILAKHIEAATGPLVTEIRFLKQSEVRLQGELDELRADFKAAQEKLNS